ncbi:MAG: HEPN domain-containing protein [Elusimicrobiota bacterium]
MAADEVKRWFEIADKDLSEAEFLLKNERPLEDVAFFVQQAAEKYLKGFLISNGWELRKIHDLISLIGEAIKIDKKFEEFSQPFQMVTKYYFDSRYPVWLKYEVI